MPHEPDKKLTKMLKRLELAVNGPGDPLDSECTWEDIPGHIAEAKEYSAKPYCVVEDWQLWNLICTQDDYNFIVDNGWCPSLIYARSIVDDERRRAPRGHRIRSNYVVNVVKPGLIETMNSMYILVGDGIRKDVHLRVADMIIFGQPEHPHENPPYQRSSH